MKKIIKAMSLAALATAAMSCGGGKEKNAQVVEEAPAVRIATTVTVSQDVPQVESYTSNVEAYAINNIAPQTGGRIKSIKVDVGDFVKKGQVLATMDDAQLTQAKLKLVNDSTELSRLKGLYEEGGVSKSDFDAAEMAYKVSRRSYQNLVENTYLVSPLNGVITARNYDSGDMYSGNPIYVLEQVTPVKVLFGVSESHYTDVKVGDSVELAVDAFPGRTFTGKVNKLYPTIDPASHTFQVEVVVANADRALRPGMYAKATIQFAVNHSVVVPDNAVVKQQGSGVKFVYVVQPDNTVKGVQVKLGKHFGTSYEVLEGLEEGVRIATRGSNALKDGDKVQIVSND